MALGRTHWRYIRAELQRLLQSDLDAAVFRKCLVPMEKAKMLLPCRIGDYTDFYASKEHAVNVGTMFRGKENALNPNWIHLPVGYHGRSSSIVVSGSDIRRPCGQVKPVDSDQPIFTSSKKMDFELEMAFVVGVGNEMGQRISVEDGEEHIFGVVLMNDWSARDIQAWEYVPLGPFLGKNFGTTISPWIVTLDALEAGRVSGPLQDQTLPYLQSKGPSHFNVNLQVFLRPAGSDQEYLLTTSNLKHLYWSFTQQLAHHTINGCNMQTGDLCGTGTISGPVPFE